MIYFLDTNICIYVLRNRYPSLNERLLSFSPSRIKLPAMVLAELFAGAADSQDPARSKKAISSFVSSIEIIDFDKRAAEAFGELRSGMSRAGVNAGPFDLIIAAIVISRNGTLVTNNTKEFSRIPGLLYENWL